jgi:hypothetical protein
MTNQDERAIGDLPIFIRQVVSDMKSPIVQSVVRQFN